MMNWHRLLHSGRLGAVRDAREERGRSPFHKDHDRIIFSGSFRRLGRKTQVHPLANNDHVHTRLTHSLEVACVGRSLGMLAGERLQAQLPDWTSPADLGVIVQAACLAHDIGNPPFGHAGEYAIRDWFRQAGQQGLLEGLSEAEKLDLQTYEGNAQGLRVVTQIEYNQFDGGMRLTHATRKALEKAGWSIEQLDLVEANEAFAAQALCVNRELGWDTSKVNVNGGAIALGHPIGASGCRVLVSLVHEMIKQDAKKGLATLCIGGGQGVALAIER